MQRLFAYVVIKRLLSVI